MDRFGLTALACPTRGRSSRAVTAHAVTTHAVTAADVWAHVPWGPRVNGSHCTGTSRPTQLDREHLTSWLELAH